MQRSSRGKLPAWIAGYLDAENPAAQEPGEIPAVTCPELVLTETGWSLIGFASPAHDLGLAAWLSETYAPLSPHPIIGGPDGIPEALLRAHLFLPAETAAAGHPQLAWLARKLDALAAQASPPSANANVPPANPAAPAPDRVALFPSDSNATGTGGIAFALLHLRALRDIWRRELRDNQFKRLQAIVPYTWILDPAPLPPHAVIPRLEVNSIRAVAGFSREARASLLLASAGGITLAGRDASDDQWRDAVNEALDGVAAHPCVLREAVLAPRTVAHPVWDPELEEARTLEARVVLKPFYVTQAGAVTLAAVLATLESAGDSVFAPCSIT